MTYIVKTIKSFALKELVTGMYLTLKYMFSKSLLLLIILMKKHRLALVFGVSMRCGVTQMVRSVALRANYVRLSAPLRRL